MLKENFIAEIEAGIRRNWNQPALADYQGGSATYGQVADRIVWLHHIFHKNHVKRGDRVAILGRNSKNWGIVYLATVSYGAVVVPIMPDFHPDDVHHIVNHSGSVLLFADTPLFEALDEEEMKNLDGSFSLERFELLAFRKKHLREVTEKAALEYLHPYKNRLDAVSFRLSAQDNKELAAIVYTSGTTGFSKGVMLPCNSLMGNVKFARENLPLKAGDRILSFLPIAHCYGCAFDFLFPFIIGCHITFLGKIPSPKLLVAAFAEIRPRAIFTVPLVLEKIYKKQIKPKLDKAVVKVLLKVPGVGNALLGKIRAKLMAVFGGEVLEIVIGGAALSPEVEEFFKKIRIPITVGYGMTECGPLISYSPAGEHRAGSIGRVLAGLMEVRINAPDPQSGIGEIFTRGEHLMFGYYKNKEATDEVLDREGWLHTGDLGCIDEAGFIYIKGRSKSMYLGPSGENIYPEPIEAKLNELDYVQESVVVMREGRLVALVYPDYERADATKTGEHDMDRIMEKNRLELNRQLPAYSQVTRIILHPEEFEKTPKKSIKRFLYTAG